MVMVTPQPHRHGWTPARDEQLKAARERFKGTLLGEWPRSRNGNQWMRAEDLLFILRGDEAQGYTVSFKDRDGRWWHPRLVFKTQGAAKAQIVAFLHKRRQHLRST